MNRKVILRKIKEVLKFLPDKAYIQLYYFVQFKHFCNLENPKTYNEKLNWLKLNDRNPEYIKLVDKYEVKKFVSNIIGEEYVIPTIGIWDNFDDINFDLLPNQFVLKCTHDSEGIVIVKDKSKLDKQQARKKINKALKCNYYYIGREWPYKNVKPRIIAEKYMEDDKLKELRDYKFFCFNGQPTVMYIASDRGIGKTKFDFYDMNFNHLNIIQHYPNASEKIEKPKNFDKMLEVSKKLSNNLKHVRVDFYEVNGKIYFGEFTFYHLSGLQPFIPDEWDYKFGEWLDLEFEKEKREKNI